MIPTFPVAAILLKGSTAFTHRSENPELMLDDRGSVWMQVGLDKDADDCCPGFGPHSISLDNYIYSRGQWFIYYHNTNPGRVHQFMNFCMVHESRLGDGMWRGRVPSAVVYQGDESGSNAWFPSIIDFFKVHLEGCGIHVHVELFYPESDLDAFPGLGFDTHAVRHSIDEKETHSSLQELSQISLSDSDLSSLSLEHWDV